MRAVWAPALARHLERFKEKREERERAAVVAAAAKAPAPKLGAAGMHDVLAPR
jgi:hypothetical protein